MLVAGESMDRLEIKKTECRRSHVLGSTMTFGLKMVNGEHES
mgnify:CR=1 FL=1